MIRKANRTYTNASLGAVPDAEPSAAVPTAGAVFESRSLGKAVSAEEMVSRSESKVESDNTAKQSEQTWQMRAATLRKQIDDMKSKFRASAGGLQLLDASSSVTGIPPSSAQRFLLQDRKIAAIVLAGYNDKFINK